MPAPRLAGWLQAAHPFPIVAVLSLTGLVGVVSARGEPAAGRFAVLMLAMLLSQLCIGWTNDYLDRDLDARFQPDKPAPSGLVPPGGLRAAAAVAGVASLGLGAYLGPAAWLLLVAGTGAGLAYDFGVKATRLSWLPYVIGLAVLPSYVWTALEVYRDDFLWLYVMALPLPVAVHLANVLPDFDADAATGRMSTAVALGRGRTMALLAGCLALSPGLSLLGAAWLTYDGSLLAVVLVAYAFGAIAAIVCLRSRHRRLTVWGFRLTAAAGILFTIGWLAAV